ncbi:DNA-3-methyladenine glycosylase [Sediminicoccus sp. KRV36]|uniref:DNA-3-methyladenine glycosylase family protein n=1 Tax=Sediminicoccus sp. KRV36 TaxID=3133721 RepID=UPI0020104306|nr:DNA-3-methyladenine glycosylase [Sediminicoccus rosea]UPY37603.1 DNA-3-methyladenine glycosylase [Sediminicoccus rosea]
MSDWQIAERKLSRDKLFRPLVKRIGPCTLVPLEREPYEALIRAIAHQQVHGRAAEAMLNRFRALYEGEEFPSAEFVLALPPEALRGCGFSGSKVLAIQDIAAKTKAGLVPSLEEAAGLKDAALIERLVAIRGVGRWTVEMLLIFTLGRADILPVDDFGVREGWRLLNGLEAQPKPKELASIGEAWAPWRSIAAWYLWRAADEGKKVKVSAV